MPNFDLIVSATIETGAEDKLWRKLAVVMSNGKRIPLFIIVKFRRSSVS